MLQRKKIKDLAPEDKKLLDSARQAISKSYAPYSNFHVGAAVRLENGEVVLGANQENASYPVGICAERSTLSTAQNIYPNEPVVAIALSARNKEEDYTESPVTPCGMCRQAMAEVEMRYQRPLRILMGGREDVIIAENVNDILPGSFTL